MEPKEKLGNYADGSKPSQLDVRPNAIYWEEVTPDMKLTAREGSWFANDRLVYWTSQTAADARAKLGQLYQDQKKREKPDLELKALNQFSGTQQYYRVLGFNVTDGIHYIMENGYSYLVTDLLAVCLVGVKGTRLRELARTGSFLVITYKVDREARTGIWEIREDSDQPILYSQKYEYTNAKVEEVKMFLIDRVLMLAGEY